MKAIVLALVFVLTACSSVTVETPAGFKLTAKSNKKLTRASSAKTISVSQPVAAAGYESSDMRYVKRPYQLESFIKNQWVAKPKDMLSPLIVQSLQNTGYFKAVVPSSFLGKSDFRLDTELLLLQQDFISRPSKEVISIKIALYDQRNEKLVRTRVFTIKEPAPIEGPYGGVIAANRGLKKILDQAMVFVVQTVKRT